MPKCNRCGSSDVVEHKGELRCSVCDTVIPVRQPENFTYDKASGGFVVDNPTKRVTETKQKPARGLTHSRPINAPKWKYIVIWAENRIGCSLVVTNQGQLKGEDIDEAFDALGEDGWELVANGTKSSLFGPMRRKTYFVFKREC